MATKSTFTVHVLKRKQKFFPHLLILASLLTFCQFPLQHLSYGSGFKGNNGDHDIKNVTDNKANISHEYLYFLAYINFLGKFVKVISC